MAPCRRHHRRRYTLSGPAGLVVPARKRTGRLVNRKCESSETTAVGARGKSILIGLSHLDQPNQNRLLFFFYSSFPRPNKFTRGRRVIHRNSSPSCIPGVFILSHCDKRYTDDEKPQCAAKFDRYLTTEIEREGISEKRNFATHQQGMGDGIFGLFISDVAIPHSCLKKKDFTMFTRSLSMIDG